MLTIVKFGLPLLGVLALAAILVVALGSGKGEDLSTEAGMDTPSASLTGIPAIDAAAPTETKTATFALG
ncbi:MAG: hypothetical protein M8467_07785 [Anaerolineae bacterium]|nr:hypothetical protein [Anaerolineae bacterium]